MTTTEKKIIEQLTIGYPQTVFNVSKMVGSTVRTVTKVRDMAMEKGIISVSHFNGCKVAYKLNDVVRYRLTDWKGSIASVSDEVFHLEIKLNQRLFINENESIPQTVLLDISREFLNQLKEVPTGDFDYDDAPDNVPFF